MYSMNLVLNLLLSLMLKGATIHFERATVVAVGFFNRVLQEASRPRVRRAT